ncbi:MAG: stage V sporulation protein D [Peptococcaceae bacterium BRH_c4b]|nr:MAG: stage V sporulation protein D [Peptococcaceae bacterium BRH_c4b]
MKFLPKKYRLVAILAGSVLLFVILLGRLSWLQLVKGEELSQMASGIRVKDEVLKPVRGTIYDRNRNELVTSVPVNSVIADPSIIGDPAKEAARIAPLLDMKTGEIMKKLTSKGQYVLLKNNVDADTTDSLKKLGINGLFFEEKSRRSFRQPGMAAHMLGFVGLDNEGLNGLEKSFDKELRGVTGTLLIETDAQGRQLPQTVSRRIPPVPGSDLVLTMDQSIQFFVERELDRVVQENSPSRAVIMVADPKTGEILAMGTRPTFDPENWNKYPQSIWDKNPATLYNYEPGSTFKIITAAAALEEGVVKETDRFYDPGYIQVKGGKIYCWDRSGHGAESFAEGVANSCNPVYIQVGLKIGREKLYRYINGFGFGQSTGIDLPWEEKGVVKTKEKVTELDLATISIGQSVSVTPVQMLRALCAVANGGRLMQLHLVKSVNSSDGKVVKYFEPESDRQVISEATSRQLSKLLQKVVLEGTGKSAFVEGYRVAGKTGTAQVPEHGGYAQGRYVASFAGFAPADDPRIAVLVMVAEPKGGKYYGSEVAAPAFQAVARDTLRYLRVPEDPALPVPKDYIKETNPAPVPVASTKRVVPNVVGFPLDDALQALKTAGFYGRLEGKQGSVSEQKPPGGTILDRGGTVLIKVSPASTTGLKDQVVVPDLRGMTVKKAGMLLEEVGLNLNPYGSGLAARQSPAPGTKLSRNSTVIVEFVPPRG